LAPPLRSGASPAPASPGLSVKGPLRSPLRSALDSEPLRGRLTAPNGTPQKRRGADGYCGACLVSAFGRLAVVVPTAATAPPGVETGQGAVVVPLGRQVVPLVPWRVPGPRSTRSACGVPACGVVGAASCAVRWLLTLRVAGLLEPERGSSRSSLGEPWISGRRGPGKGGFPLLGGRLGPIDARRGDPVSDML